MLLTRPPLPLRGARLACVRPAASVRSEPGSNSQVDPLRLTNALFVLIDEVFALPTHEKPETLILQSRQKNASLELDLVFARLSPDVAIKPPPTFPFLESQCQRAFSDVNFHLARETTPPARQGPAGGVGAVYRRVLLPCQTGNRAAFAFFGARRAAHCSNASAGHFGGQPIWGRSKNTQ